MTAEFHRVFSRFAFANHLSSQLGKGLRLDCRKSSMRRRMDSRRSWTASTIRSNPSESCLYHSGTIASAQRQVGKRPLLCVQAVTLINKKRLKFACPALADKDRLAAVGIAQPLIKDKNPSKRQRLSHLRHEALRQVVEDFQRLIHQIAGIARSKLQATAARNFARAKLNAQFRGILDQPVGHFDCRRLRHGKAKPQAKRRGEHLVRENSNGLWVVLEFGDIVCTVGCSKEMGL